VVAGNLRRNDVYARCDDGRGLHLDASPDHREEESVVSRRSVRGAARFAGVLLLWLRGAAPTLVVLLVLVALGVPPYGHILTDLRRLFSLLIG